MFSKALEEITDPDLQRLIETVSWKIGSLRAFEAHLQSPSLQR